MIRHHPAIEGLTGNAIGDDKDADGLVAESGILNLRNVDIQNLPEFTADRCLACGGMSNVYADSVDDNLLGQCR
jgi:hypothetical protein